MSNADHPKPGKTNRASRKRALIRRDGSICVKCRAPFRPEALTFDHVVPQSRGGGWALTNLQLMCQPCNVAKGAR
jgi:5-methylcytosine-specific restriction endonuclease McrA